MENMTDALINENEDWSGWLVRPKQIGRAHV